jgi:uncharacterized membrane protein
LSSESANPRIKIRIEGLSDIVFGLALSIGSLVLISNFPKSPDQLGLGILLFSFSFFIVIFSWVGYTRTMAVLPVEVQGAFIINIVLLLCVALEPYLFYVLFSAQDPSLLYWASFGYAIDVGAIFVMLAGLCYILIQESKKPGTELRVHPSLVVRFRRAMKAQIIIGIIFLASSLPIFWVETPVGFLRFFFWDASIPAFIFWIPIQRRRDSKVAR